MSGPASAPSPSGSRAGAIRGPGCHLLRRQWPSAPPVARKVANFDNRQISVKVEAEKTLTAGKIEHPRENQGVVGWGLALLESEWDVQKGPDPPKLEMPKCCHGCTQLGTDF